MLNLFLSNNIKGQLQVNKNPGPGSYPINVSKIREKSPEWKYISQKIIINLFFKELAQKIEEQI